jgi:hypothetical protein
MRILSKLPTLGTPIKAIVLLGILILLQACSCTSGTCKLPDGPDPAKAPYGCTIKKS